MVFPRPLLPPMMTTFLPRKRCAFLNSFMAQSFHKDTIQFCIFSGYPVDRSDLVHAKNVWLFHAICRIALFSRAKPHEISVLFAFTVSQLLDEQSIPLNVEAIYAILS